jgi:hypothetical protein
MRVVLAQQDKWRGAFIRLVVEVTPITAREAGEMLRCMDWGTERMEVFMNVYGQILDHENLYLAWAPLLSPERIAVIRRLGPQLLLYVGSTGRWSVCNVGFNQRRWLPCIVLPACRSARRRWSVLRVSNLPLVCT